MVIGYDEYMLYIVRSVILMDMAIGGVLYSLEQRMADMHDS